jgi:hypothetical protein
MLNEYEWNKVIQKLRFVIRDVRYLFFSLRVFSLANKPSFFLKSSNLYREYLKREVSYLEGL